MNLLCLLRATCRLAFSVFVLGTIGCATVSFTPTWVNGEPPEDYPKQEFVSALGAGETFEAAQIAAKGELSRVFSADVQSEIELIDRESVVDQESVQSSDLFVNTTISTNLELQGAEVPLHWRDEKAGQVWALAVLERRKECLRIRREGNDLGIRLDALVEDARLDVDALAAIRARIQAAKIGVELDGLQARSRVLGNQCLASRSASTGELKSEVGRGLRRLSFVVTTRDVDPRSGRSKGPLPQLREQIAANLTSMGFQVGPAEGAEIVLVDASLRLQRVRRSADWVEYRWEGSAEIGSSNPGTPARIVAESEGAESHPEDSTARLRARRKGEQDLARQLDGLLKAFFEGE